MIWCRRCDAWDDCRGICAKIQMGSEQNTNSWARRAAIVLFLQHNATAPYLQTIQTCLQAVLYVSVINGFQLVPALFTPSTASLAIGLLLSGLFLARVAGGLSLIKFAYIPILCYAITDICPSGIGMMVGVGVLLVVQVGSSISFDFFSDNLSSQSLNSSKLLHFAGMALGVAQSALGGSFILDGVCCGLWIGVWLYKRASVCRDRAFKELQLLVYLWLASSHLMVMVQAWLTLPLVIQLALPLFFTQAVLRIYLQKRGTSRLEQLYSQENYLKMAFEVMVYLHGEAYSAPMDRQIEAFLADPNYLALKDTDRRRMVSEKLLEVLSRRNGFEEQLISSQILLFHGHQLLKAKALLSRLQAQVGWASWMRRICLYRVQEALRQMHGRKTKEIHFAHYEQYYRCDAFRSMLLRSAAAFLALWEYSRRPEVIAQRVRVLADRLVLLQRRLRRDFAAIQPKCLTLSLLYVSYLLEVARDSTAANLILQGLAFNEDFEISLQLDEKLFVQITLEGECPLLRQVGPNASLLLGFERKELQGQRVDVFLPEFYRKFHSNYVDECFQKQFPRLYLYCKKTIVRNRWGYYQQCSVMLRLHFSPEGQLMLRGYLQVRPNNNFLWTHFLFIAENEEILQCSQNLSSVAPSVSRLHRAGQLFQDVNLSQALYQKTSESLVQYQPLLVFGTDTQRVYYYVRAVKEQEWVGAKNGREDVGHLLESMQLRRLEWNIIKSYYIKAQELIRNLYSKEYILLGAVLVAAVGGLLLCEGYFLFRADGQASDEQTVMGTTSQILSYYDSSIELGMRIAYIGLRRSYNYTNTISTNNLLNLSLVLQTNNQKLKGLTRNRYSLPSLIPNVTYSKPNYDMIVELLSNSYMIRQFLDDPFLQSTVLSRAQLSIFPIFATSIGEYEGNFVQSVRQIPPDTGQFVTIACLMVLVLLICIVVFRLEHRLRRDQQQALILLVSVRHQEELISTAKQFISKITREDLANLRYQQENPHRNAVYNTTFAQEQTARGDHTASRSEMSLREISGRDLLGDSFNRSGVLQTAITSRIDAAPQAFSSQTPQITLTPRKRWLYGFCLGLAGVIGGLSLANQAQNNIRGEIDLFTSVTNIFAIFSTGTIFSRSMVLFLNLVAQRNAGPVDTTQFDAFMSNYSQTQVVVTFPEGSFTQFSPFQDMLSQVTYQYMCTYLACDPNFAGEINIIYTTTIQKLIASALTYKTQLNNMTIPALASSVSNGTMTRFIDLVFYAEMNIRGQLLKLISLYLSCFDTYSSTLKMKKRILMGAAMGATLASLGLLVGLAVWVGRHQGLLRDISNLVKTDSYINQDNQIADKEAFRPSNSQSK